MYGTSAAHLMFGHLHIYAYHAALTARRYHHQQQLCAGEEPIHAYPSLTCSDGVVRRHSEGRQRRTLGEILCIQPDTSEVIN